MGPCHGVWDVNGPASELQWREDIGTGRVSNHDKMGGIDVFAFKEACVGVGFFVLEYVVGNGLVEWREDELSRLFAEIAFGEDANAVLFLELGHGLGDAGQHLDGTFHQLASDGEYGLNGPGGEIRAERGGGLDHRQRHRFAAVSEERHVALFGAGQMGGDVFFRAKA